MRLRQHFSNDARGAACIDEIIDNKTSSAITFNRLQYFSFAMIFMLIRRDANRIHQPDIQLTSDYCRWDQPATGYRDNCFERP